ncbi:MAG: AAA family ATPase [Armatimonadetes bacterium]|nr:AAA family ATPase [Armatimonadota bacterium]
MSKSWRLSLFGPVGLHSEKGSYTDFETRRAAKILVLLSFSRSGRLRREDLADLLWPEDFIDSTRLRLRQELSRLRRGIGDAGDLIHASTDEVIINKELVYNDLERLSHPDRISPDELIELLSESFLAGWDDAWVTPKRREADQCRVNAAIQWASKLLSEKHPERALEISQAAMRLSKENEEVVKLAMKAHAEMGSVSEALIEFRRFKREHREANLEEIEITVAPTPGHVALPEPPHPIDRFYGRGQELDDVLNLLTSDEESRLISIVGPGGIGKTRLAIEVAAKLEGDLGYVSFVECPSDERPEQYLLSRLVHGHEVIDAYDALHRIFESRSCVMVFDNLEHLNGAGEFANRILSENPSLKLLVTSRSPMKIAGERVVGLGPLDLSQEAIPMLQSLVSNWKSSDRDRQDYDEIVNLCGGIPLTLRLAAARLRMLDPEELIQDIRESGAALRANLADLADRHKNFDEVVKVSWNSLELDEQEALLAISVFPEGVTRAIAKSLIGSQVDDILERLLDSSMIWLDDEGSPLRFRLLQPIQHFVAKEVGSERLATAQHQFIRTMREVAATLTLGWQLPPASDAIVYRREATNFRAALSLGIEMDHESAHAIFERIWDPELAAGRRRELVQIGRQLESLPNATAFQKGQVALCRSWCEAAEGKYAECAEIALQAHALFEQADAQPEACYAATCSFEATRYALPWDQVEPRYKELLELANRVAPEYAPSIHVSRGMVLVYRGEWEKAASDLRIGYERSQTCGHLALQCLAGTYLLGYDYIQGNRAKVEQWLTELPALLSELDDSHYWVIYYRTAALIQLAQGGWQAAERTALLGKNVFSLAKNPMHEVEIRLALVRALLGQDRIEEAKSFFNEIGPDISACWRRVKVMALAVLAEIRSKEGQTDEAKGLLGIAAKYFEEHSLKLFAPEMKYFDDCHNTIGATPCEAAPTDAEIDDLVRD